MMMLPAFFERVIPVSTIAKPHCMKNTQAAPIRYHMPFTSLPLYIVSSTTAWTAAF